MKWSGRIFSWQSHTEQGRRWYPWVILAFRFTAVAVAGIQIASFPDNIYHRLLSPVILLIIAALYSLANMFLPYSWYKIGAAKSSLIIVDVLISASFIALTGIHSPFLLYSLVPVLGSALLFNLKFTFAIGGFTAAYVLASLLFNTPLRADERLEAFSDFAQYLPLLTLVILLPYLVNATKRNALLARAALDERKRLACEIHDGICQLLYGLRLHAQKMSQDIDDAQKVSQEAAIVQGLAKDLEDEARSTLNSLNNSSCEVGLLSQIQDCLDRLRIECTIEGRLEADTDPDTFDRLIEVELSRICQEALRNVAKHSSARNVNITLKALGGHVELKIRDDGQGIAHAVNLDSKYGLRVMRERAKRLGGEMTVLTRDGIGTEVIVSVPKRLQVDIVS